MNSQVLAELENLISQCQDLQHSLDSEGQISSDPDTLAEQLLRAKVISHLLYHYLSQDYVYSNYSGRVSDDKIMAYSRYFCSVITLYVTDISQLSCRLCNG